MPTTIDQWSPLTEHVQDDIPSSGSFLDAKTVLFAAGPSRLSKGGSGGQANVAYPIGVLENVMIGQNKVLQRIFEIGSIRSYFVPGRTIGQFSIGRTMYNGRNLLRVFYEKIIEGGKLPNGKMPRLDPGASLTDEFWINMASDVFNYPFGLLAYIVDNNLNSYGGMYLEECYFQGHQLSINSQSTAIVEGTSGQFDLCIPVKVPKGALKSAQSNPLQPVVIT